MRARRPTFGLAVAMTLVFGTAPAFAGPGSVCTVTKKNTSVDHTGSDGSECFASSDGHSKGHATATGDKSEAEADGMTGGKATAIANGVSSFSDASADGHGHSTSTAMGDGTQANAVTDAKGKAKSTANGTNSEADSSAFGKCKATSMATTGPHAASKAVANCSHNGTFVSATATDGGMAEGSDDAPPTCDPGAHGTATVHSSGGDC